MGDLRKRVYDDVDWHTRHWSKYLTDWNRYAEPQNTYRGYVSRLYEPVQRLWRSASSSSLSAYNESVYERGSLRRSSSYSSLAPSNAIRFRERSVDRYVPKYTAYTPKSDEWRREQSAYQRSASFSRALQEKSASRRPSYSSGYSSASLSSLTRGSLYSTSYSPYSSYGARSSPYSFGSSASLSSYSRLGNSSFSFNYSSSAEIPRRTFTKPTTWGRLDYPYGYYSGQLKGLDTMYSWLYRNYDLDDDRKMNKIHSPVQSIKAPHVLKNFQGSWYQTTPGRVLTVYYNNTRY